MMTGMWHCLALGAGLDADVDAGLVRRLAGIDSDMLGGLTGRRSRSPCGC